ncbi:MAG TPA: DNA-binding protein [Actinomycetota bacterium]
MPSKRRRIRDRLTETDEDRLAAEVREWADGLSGTVRIAEAPVRARVRLAGAVRRISIRPVKGFDALGVLFSDGTGEVAVEWLGRRTIPGLTLGSRLVLEGVLGLDGGMLRMVNPTFEFVTA